MRIPTLTILAFLAACGDPEQPLCEVDRGNGAELLYESEGHTTADCFNTETGELNAGPAIAAKLDVNMPFVDLGVLGADWMYLLGANTEFTIWDPLVFRTVTIGYNAVGGDDDYDPDHSPMYVTKTAKVDVEGDGIVDKVYEAVPIPETPEGQFFQGTYVNLDNPDCDSIGDDLDATYEELAGCYAMYSEACGAAYTAYDVDAANLGDCSLSAIAHDGIIEPGPELSTF